MDNLVEKRSSEKAKTKKKPMKVVYISNPMKFTISASEFRALVQELTGQDSELPDPSKFVYSDDHLDVGDKNQTVQNATKSSSISTVVVDDDNEDQHSVVPKADDPKERSSPAPPYQSFDDVFMPSMFDNFSGTTLVSSSGLLYDSITHVDVLDAM